MKNIKYRNRQKIEKNDAESYKDFNSVLRFHNQMSGSITKLLKTFKIGIPIISAITVATILYVNSIEIQSPEITKNEMEEAYYNSDYEVFKIDPAVDNEIFTKVGTKIIVPKESLIDNKGKLATGIVELVYQDYYHPIDAIMNNISMQYDSAGTVYHFESAGMFKIRARQNGNPLSIINGKSINVLLRSPRNEPVFNQYKFDDKNNEWKYIAHKSPIVRDFDKEIYEAESEIYRLKNNIDKIKANIPAEPVKEDKSNIQVRLNIDKLKYPELELYNEIIFEIPESNKQFTREDTKKKWIAKVNKTSNPLEYDIELQRFKRIIKLSKAKIVVTEENYGSIKEKYNEIIASYAQKVQAKEEELRKYRAELQQMQKERQIIASEANRNYFRSANFSNTTSGFFYRAFIVEGFGLYNSDCPQKLPAGAQLAVSFVNKDKKEMPFQKVYLVELNNKRMFTYHKDMFNAFCFDPNEANIIVGVKNANDISIFKKEDFKALIGRKEAALTMHMVGKVKDINHAREILLNEVNW